MWVVIRFILVFSAKRGNFWERIIKSEPCMKAESFHVGFSALFGALAILRRKDCGDGEKLPAVEAPSCIARQLVACSDPDHRVDWQAPCYRGARAAEKGAHAVDGGT
eukprot:5982723-Amphidinium_carterae.2